VVDSGVIRSTIVVTYETLPVIQFLRFISPTQLVARVKESSDD
jgi:hypothetical protein